MSRDVFAIVLIAALGQLSAGCSDRSPVAPAAAAVGDRSLSARTEKVSGIYELSPVAWIDGSYQEVSTLPVAGEVFSEGLALRARVRDSSGQPAVTGTVIFESCSLRGTGAPAAACDSGQGRWQRIWAMEVAPDNVAPEPGTAAVHFGSCTTPQTIGFRFRYVHGDVVANGIGGPANVTWVEN
jgi:hypothetical protein